MFKDFVSQVWLGVLLSAVLVSPIWIGQIIFSAKLIFSVCVGWGVGGRARVCGGVWGACVCVRACECVCVCAR